MLDTHPAGPDHENVPVPVAVSCTVDPSQVCVNVGLADTTGGVLIVTFMLVVAVHPFGLVTVSVYVPLLADVTFGMVGSFKLLVNPFGPVHAYAPAPVPCNLSVLPVHAVFCSHVAVATGG